MSQLPQNEKQQLTHSSFLRDSDSSGFISVVRLASRCLGHFLDAGVADYVKQVWVSPKNFLRRVMV